MVTKILLAAAQKGIHLYVKDGRLAFKAPKNALTEELQKKISENKNKIIEFLASQNQKKSQNENQIRKVGDGLSKSVLSFSQQRLWLLDQIEGSSPHYNLASVLRCLGHLNHEAVLKALTTILERHESLRTCFALDVDGQPIQVIQDAVSFQLQIIDLAILEESERQLQLAKLAAEESVRVFDLSSDLMLRAQLIKLAEQEHIVLVTMHHIAADGWSFSILIDEFSALYSAYIQGKENPLPPRTIQYADYAHWQRNWLQGEVLDQQLGYWTTQLAGLPVVHSLPLDHPRPAIQSFTGNTYSSQLDATTSKTLSALCQSQGATLFMGLHAAFSVLLSRYSNETDIVVGSPIANREQAEIAGLIGFFVNTLVLRSNLSESPSFIRLLSQSKTMLLDAYAHQQVPFEQIVEHLQPERSLSHSALFQVMLVLQNIEQSTLELPELALSLIEPSKAGIAKYDLTLTITENEQGLRLGWEYNTDLFGQETIARMANHFELLLRALVTAPNENVFKVDMLGAQERQQLVLDWNDTQADYPSDKCIHELFESQVNNNPNAIAVTFENQHLTYEQLNQKANQLAHYLLNEKHIKPDTLVGICVERSLHMVIGILAILKAGGAYVPLDPDYPEARLKYMLDDAKLTTVLTQRLLRETTPVTNQQAVCLDDEHIQQKLQTQSTQNPNANESGLTSNHLAYVIYTSGSTGNPKGVSVIHSGVVNYLNFIARVYFTSVEGSIVSSPLAFDATVTSLLGPLFVGKWMHIVPQDGNEIERLAALFMTLNEASLFKITPAHMEGLAHYLQGKILQDVAHWIIIGGDQLTTKLASQWKLKYLPQAILVNEYGPTETVVGCSIFIIANKEHLNPDSHAVAIGKPIDNTVLLVLDSEEKIQPIAVAGELYIGGVGLARGYLNRPDLTAEKFIPNPFHDKTNPSSSERLYRTGDLVRWLPDGNLEYLGRIDHQVKIRGFRIELGEIENTLSSCSAVNDVIVLAKESTSGDKRLVAYIATDAIDLLDESEISIAARHDLIESLRHHVNQVLPDYMVPAAFVLLAQLPLTPNGKVDRKSLPEPDISSQQNAYVAPRTETEKVLCDIWQELLGVERVGITDNFFQLGGHSLLIMQLISRLQQHDIFMAARQLFTAPQVIDLANVLDANDSGATSLFKAPENLIPSECSHITPDMLPLVSLSEEEIATIVAQIPGVAANVQDIYPLGPLQQGILFHHMMSTEGDAYVLPSLFKLGSREAVNGFIDALQFIINRHDALRTAVFWQGLSVPVQVVCRKVSLPVSWLELDSSQTVEEHMRARCVPGQQWMDVGQAPLLQLQVAANPDAEDYFVLLQFHHLISDHVGLEIIQKELAIYQTGKVDALPIAIPYREFIAHAQHQALHNDAEAFFRKTLGDVEEPTAPFGLRNVNGDGSHIVEVRELVPAAVSSQLRELAKTLTISPAALFHTAWAMVVAGCSGRDDVVFGTVLSGRLQGTVGAEHMLGVFINTLPLRVMLLDISVLDAVRQVQNSLLNLLPYEQTSLALAQRCSGLPTSSTLFTAMINYRHSTAAGSGSANPSTAQNGLVFEFLAGQERTNYPFNVSIDDFGHDFGLEIQVDKALNAERIAGYVQTAIAGLVGALQQHPTQPINSLSILPESERKQLLVEWTNTQADYPNDKCVHELFEAQVENNPNAIAVIFKNQQLTYGQLNEKANQLAHYLITEKHVKPDTLVGICVERSLDMVIGILAILKAGGAYVPLDPEYPEARLTYMLDDAKLMTVITQQTLVDRLSITASEVLCLDGINIQQQIEKYSDKNPTGLGLNTTHLAYINYTSGSTGNPKGVMITQRAVVSLVINNNYVPLSHTTVMLHNATISFDAATFEIWGALLNGGKMVIQGESLIGMDALGQFINVHHINTAWLTAGLFQQFATHYNQPLVSLDYLLVGGDIVDKHAVHIIRKNNNSINVINGYGPTENTTFSCCYYMPETLGDVTSIPIGKPLSNRTAYVLDKALNVVPQGIAGELHVGGVGLARGYLNRPDLTAEKFIPNPFYDKTNPLSSERLYKTGDLVRWLPDGNLEYLGRIDSQVKIRGFRIELGEIENTLSGYSAVKDAIVLATESVAGDKRLVAYVVADTVDLHSEDETAITARHEFIETLRQHLLHTLPDYMVPSAFVLLAQMPLTPNGKVDRKALPEPDSTVQQHDYVAPCTATEKLLCEIWQEVLGVERVGINDNFFQLGGHSLLLMQVISRVQQQGLSMTARQLFSQPDVASLAKVLDVDRSDALPVFKAPANLIPEGCKHVTPEMLPLVSLSEEEIAHIVDKIPGGAANVQDIYPLGPLQEGILFQHMMSAGGDAYVLPSLFKIRDHQALTGLIESLQFIINRHDVLRTAILWQELSAPVQVVCREASLPVTWLELDSSQPIEAHMRARCAPGQQWIELDKAPLLQLEVALDPVSGQHFVLLQYHHIISDHVGLEIIQRELELYQAGLAVSLPAPIPYREFIAHAQHQSLHHDATAFFTGVLGDVEEPTAPFDLREVNGNGSQIVEMRENVPAAVSSQLRSVAKGLMISPAALFHTAWAMVVASCSGRDDVVFGTVMSGRLQGTLGAEHMLGVFINTLPLRVTLQAASVIDTVRQVQDSLLNLLPYEQAPLVLVQRCSRLPAGSPLFTAMFNYRHTTMIVGSTEATSTNESTNNPIEFLTGQERTNYPFTLSVDDLGEAFSLDVQVDNSLDAQRIVGYVQMAVAGLVTALQTAPHQPIKGLSVLPEAERHQLLVEWNNTQADYPSDKCIHELFEVQVNANPNSVAVVFENEQLTYQQLNQKANQLAHYLINEKQVRPDTLVGICVERSLAMVVGILAILKAGGAYVPLDPDYPEARLKYMLDDAKLATVLTQRHLRETTPVSDEQAVCLDDENIQQQLNIQSLQNPTPQHLGESGLTSNHLAYVIYTSGSTGNPKGSLLCHSSLCNLALAQIKGFRVTPESRVLQFASIAFDAATSELCVALLQGASLVLLNNEAFKSPAALTEVVRQQQVTHATLPPVLLSLLDTQEWRSVQTLVIAGDTCSIALANQWSQGRTLINAYGPSETTVCATMGTYISKQSILHMGKPLQNVQLYVLDGQQSLVPSNVPGELHIAGVGLSRGYLHRPDLTAEKFIVNPFYSKNQNSSKRLYKTGDLVRWLPDGNLEFLGRIDHQVKIRGFRVELGEIENVLSAHEQVKDVVVLARASASRDGGDRRLVAYVVNDSLNKQTNEQISELEVQVEFFENLRRYLNQFLPDYMVPSAFVLIEQFPLTPNGKIDRRALPEPDHSQQQFAYVAPRTETEEILCEIWQRILGVERVGITDNFFQLGGHSLLAVKAVTAINSVSDVKLSLKSLFSDATIISIANMIESVRSNNKLAGFESDELVKEGFL